MTDNLKTYVFRVEMTCEGCSKAVSNVLNRHKDKGIESFDINLETKTVTVTSTMELDAVTEIIKKTGKEVTFIEQVEKAK